MSASATGAKPRLALVTGGAGVRRFIYSGSSSVYGDQATLPLHVARRPGDARDTLADLSATRAALRWEPEVAPPDGVRELMRLAGCP